MSSRRVELNIISFLVQHPDSFKEYNKKLSKYCFQDTNAKILFNTLSKAVHNHNDVPTREELDSWLLDIADEKSLAIIEKEQLIQDSEYLYNSKVTGMTGDKVKEFLILNEVKELSLELANVNLANVDTEIKGIKNRIEKLGQISFSKDDLGLSVLSEHGIDEGLYHINELYSHKTITTGYPRLDQKLYGGFRPSEVCMFLGATGTGKTSIMLNFACNQVLAGHRVFYVALDNPQHEIVERVFACLSREPIVSGLKEKIAWKERLKSQLGGFNERFYTKCFPSKSKSVADIISHVTRLRNYLYELDIRNGVSEALAGRIDAIYVDYLEKLKVSDKSDLYRIDLENSCDYLLQLAQLNECPVISATQANRQGMTADSVDLHHGQESIAKFNPVAVCLGISQTKEEKNSTPSKMRLTSTGKLRRASGSFSIPFIFDISRQYIYEDLEREVLDDDFSPSGLTTEKATQIVDGYTKNVRVAMGRADLTKEE